MWPLPDVLLRTLASYCVYLLKFGLYNHDLPWCAFEIKDGRFKRACGILLLKKTWQGGGLRWGPFTDNVIWLKITWQTKTSPLPRCLWPPKLTRWWPTFRGSYPSKSHEFLSKLCCEIKLQTKIIISPLPQWYAPDLIRWEWPLSHVTCEVMW